MFTTTERKKHRILDFDIENRPLSYWFDDRTTAEITAIGWAWADLDSPPAYRVLLPPPDHENSFLRMLRDFVRVYDEADIVTGHFIRKHDLPIINAALIEFGQKPLGSKMTIDTKLDMIRTGSFSGSQLNLAGMLEVKSEKPRMTTERWRDANRLTDAGIASAIERVTGDVRQHMELRVAMQKANLLGPPRMWRP
jgi:hypothetical protein